MDNEKVLEENLESFEQKVTFAKQTLEKLSDPEITLSQSMELYQSGMKVLQEASKLLEDAKLVYQEIEAK